MNYDDNESLEKKSKETIDECIDDTAIILGGEIDDGGFDYRGIHKSTGTKYDENGFDVKGYDKGGYNVKGYDRYGYDKEGYDENGYNTHTSIPQHSRQRPPPPPSDSSQSHPSQEPLSPPSSKELRSGKVRTL